MVGHIEIRIKQAPNGNYPEMNKPLKLLEGAYLTGYYKCNSWFIKNHLELYKNLPDHPARVTIRTTNDKLNITEKESFNQEIKHGTVNVDSEK